MNIEGEYSLTITMSGSCSLPPEVRQRSYTATIREPQKGYVTVTLGGAAFALVDPPYYKAGFEGGRNGNSVHFMIDNGYGSEYTFIERIDGNNLLFEGVADTIASENTIDGNFSAEIRYFAPGAGQAGGLGDCTAGDHRMVFTRQAQR